MLVLQLDYHIKEEARMKYVNAKEILPDPLVKEYRTLFKEDTSMFLLSGSNKKVGEKFLVIEKN